MLTLLADGDLWTRMFVLDPTTVSLVEKMLRPILVYFFLLFGLRVAGKRELAQLNAFDLIVLLTLSNTVQNAIIGNDNTISGGMVGAATLLAVNYTVVRLAHRYAKLDHLIEGRAELLMRNGKIVRHRLERELITQEELGAAARKQGISSLHDVERCVLEASGTITFVQKSPTPDIERHAELVKMISAMHEEMKILRGAARAVERVESDVLKSGADVRPATPA